MCTYIYTYIYIYIYYARVTRGIHVELRDSTDKPNTLTQLHCACSCKIYGSVLLWAPLVSTYFHVFLCVSQWSSMKSPVSVEMHEYKRIWTGAVDLHGYPWIGHPSIKNRTPLDANRKAWQLGIINDHFGCNWGRCVHYCGYRSYCTFCTLYGTCGTMRTVHTVHTVR